MAVLTVADDESALAEQVASRIAARAQETIREHGRMHLCLTGGATPRSTYERLAADVLQRQIAWEQVHLYWSDERHVPPDHPDSNYGMARGALVTRVPVPPAHVHRIRGELDPDKAARDYERELPLRFDLTLLGVGADAHIASIFPGSPVARERQRRAAGVRVPHLNAFRITLTPPPLIESDRVFVIVAGASKARAVATAFDAPTDIDRYPVHLLREAGSRVEWFTDRHAARDVSSRPGR